MREMQVKRAQERVSGCVANRLSGGAGGHVGHVVGHVHSRWTGSDTRYQFCLSSKRTCWFILFM